MVRRYAKISQKYVYIVYLSNTIPSIMRDRKMYKTWSLELSCLQFSWAEKTYVY